MNHLARKIEEPSLEEVLADPDITQRVMQRDGVDEGALRSIVQAAVLKRRSEAAAHAR